tara:strand:+ start:45 stop:524 length:480 start_codon:yes stop_codon:yes gene_type:complete
MDNLEDEEEKKKRKKFRPNPRQKRWYQNWLFEMMGTRNIEPETQEVSLLENLIETEQLETIEFVQQQNKIYSNHYLLTDNITPLEARERIERAEEEKLKKYYTKLGYKNVKVKNSKWSNLSEATKKAWANKTEKQRAKHARNIAKGLKKRNKQKRAKKQ